MIEKLSDTELCDYYAIWYQAIGRLGLIAQVLRETNPRWVNKIAEAELAAQEEAAIIQANIAAARDEYMRRKGEDGAGQLQFGFEG